MTTQFTRRTLWGASLTVAAACAAPWVTATAAEAKGTRELAPARDAEATTPSPTYPITVYSVAYSPKLFMAVDGGGVRYINWEEWQHWGFPTPKPAPTHYVRLHWEDTAYAVHQWSPDPSTWSWHALTSQELAKAGYPTIRQSPWVPYIDAYKYASSDEVFYRSKDDDQVRKLTFQEWLNFGAPAPTLQDASFLKLPWRSAVFMVYSDGKGSHVTFEDWLYYGQPTPKVVPRFTGDIWSRSADGKDIVYRNDNLRFSTVVTPAEYAQAGYPPLR